jgi:hypothetical protein
MKSIVIAAALSVFIVAPAVAAEGKNSLGITYGLDMDGVVGIQGEYDISASMPDKAPVSAQFFWKNYSHSFSDALGTYEYNYNGFGAAAIYYFENVGKLDKRFKPYAGLGLITLNSSLSGPAGQPPESADTGGLYATLGVRYSVAPTFSADLNYNNYGGVTIGAILNF